MEIAEGLTKHTIVVCVGKKERGIPIQSVLQKIGYKVTLAFSIYDAIKSISLELPSLVITESKMEDGHAGNLFDKLMQTPVLDRTPILVHILKKTKEELAPLKGRAFAGFLLGALQPKSLAEKVKEVIDKNDNVSPHFITAVNAGLDLDFTISLNAMVIGRSGEQIVYRSKTEVDPAASLVCVPEDKKKSPVLLKMASNLPAPEEQVFNLFPVSRIKGKGRDWLMGLPEIDINGGGEGGDAKLRKVIFFDPNAQRFQQFKEVLLGYDIELIHANSLNMAGALLTRSAAEIDCVYLNELTTDASSMGWKQAYEKLDEADRPVVIVGTTSMSARSTPKQRYIKKPFGLGVLVETIEAAFESGADLAEASAGGSVDGAGIQVFYQAPAKLVGLDETGGIFQLRFPMVGGSRIKLAHPKLSELWGGDDDVLVKTTGSLKGKPDVWQARFESVPAGTSKAKYWEKMSKEISASAPPPPAEEPEAEGAETAEAAPEGGGEEIKEAS